MREPKLFAGARLKRLRRELKLTQVKMAEELGVSASYLNLMERNQRPVTAQVLIKLVETYELDLSIFAAGPDQRTIFALREAILDPVLSSLAMGEQDIRELSEVHPLGAQALVKLHRAYRNLSHTAAGMSEQLSDEMPIGGHNPKEVVREIIQKNEGFFHDIEEAAELFCDEVKLDRHDIYGSLTGRLQHLHSIRTRSVPQTVLRHYKRRFDRHSRRVILSDLLSPHERSFQLAMQIAHLELRDLLDEKCQNPDIVQAGPRAADLYCDWLSSYFAMAVLLPYKQVLEQAELYSYDVQKLALHFDVGIELMARRLVCLRRPGAMGLPLFLLRFDRAGTVIERFGAQSFGLSKFGGSCPKWNIWQAVAASPDPVFDFVQMGDGERLLSVAFATRRHDPEALGGSYSQITVLGCAASRAMETVYGRKLGEEREVNSSEIGPGCRICERKNCGQRSNHALTSNSEPGAGSGLHGMGLLGSIWDGL